MLTATAIVAIGLLVVSCERTDARPDAAPSPAGQQRETVFTEDFESGTLAAWQDGIDPARHRVVADPSAAQSGGHYLAVTYPPGRDGGWLTRFFEPGYDSLHVIYYVRFPLDWQGGTKLIALYGSRTDNRWSAFGKAGLCPSGSDFFAAMVVSEATGDPGPTRFYSYYPAMSREPDGVTCWGRFGDGSETYATPLTLSRGVWHRVEFSLTLNTPGRQDARQLFLIDGVQKGSWSGLSFRDSEALRLNAVQLTFSTAVLNQARELHVDNISIQVP
jgi:hypothetical protein